MSPRSRATGAHEASLLLPPRKESVCEARHFVRARLAEWGASDTAEAELLTTELATNALIHAATEFEVMVEIVDDTVTIELSDGGPGAPIPRDLTDTEQSGRGLHMVSTISASWGVRPGRQGKVVWFTLGLR